LVVSHVGYYHYSTSLNDTITKYFDLKLTKRNVVLSEVDVLDVNLRNKNMKFFQQMFLGQDVWGKYASIENDEVLSFYRKYISKPIPNFFNSNLKVEEEDADLNTIDTTVTNKIIKKTIEYRAYANEPLIVGLPLLGYELNVNLNNFVWSKDSISGKTHCSILGYYFFRQKPYESKRDSIRIKKNRMKAYYHSPVHFGRSLYDNKLAENGYEVYVQKFDTLKEKNSWIKFPIDSVVNVDNNYACIVGLKDENLKIFYYQDRKDLPLNLKTEKVKNKKCFYSTLNFISDTCFVRKDGTVPNNSILFGPPISNKRIGAMLPDNYMPYVE
jgi:hypothetical protein